MDTNKNSLDIKLIALDMDGTLLNDQHKISEANRKAIKEAQSKGIYVVLSTGRSLRTCREHADSLELSSFLVTVNGSEIWDSNNELVERSLVESELVGWMWELSKQHNTKFWAISTDSNWFNEMPEDFLSKEWLKFGFHIEDDSARETIKKKLHATGKFELTNSSEKNIEVNPAGINKAKGLSIVCQRLGIKMENVMAMGDSLNDLVMIQEAGFGIAMGNAQESVKNAAFWVTSTNNDDGVAKAIHKFVL